MDAVTVLPVIFSALLAITVFFTSFLMAMI